LRLLGGSDTIPEALNAGSFARLHRRPAALRKPAIRPNSSKPFNPLYRTIGELF
jgi:hypothetical protein